MTLIRGLPLSDADLARLAKRLKATCGVGGTAKGGAIELQGDQRDKARQALEADGYHIKLSGS